VSREDKKKYKQRLHDVEISDSLGEKIKKVSKKIKWYQKIPNKKNEGIFRRKLFKELNEEEKVEYEKMQDKIKEKVFV